jgi:hypothetical protein
VGLSPLKKAAAGIAVLALALTACTTGGDGPRTGGVAAQVGETTIRIGDVNSMTDALCVARGAAGRPMLRSQASTFAAEVLVQQAMLDEFGLGAGVEFPGDPQFEIPGWDGMSAEERAEVRTILDVQSRTESALIELGAAGSQSPAEAFELGAARFA